MDDRNGDDNVIKAHLDSEDVVPVPKIKNVDELEIITENEPDEGNKDDNVPRHKRKANIPHYADVGDHTDPAQARGSTTSFSTQKRARETPPSDNFAPFEQHIPESFPSRREISSFTSKELVDDFTSRNYGRAPLIEELLNNDDSGRPLPSVNEAAFGGGVSTQVSNNAGSPPVSLPTPEENPIISLGPPEQKSTDDDQVDPIMNGGCFPCFRI